MRCEVCKSKINKTKINNGICDVCGTHHISRVKSNIEKGILKAGFKKIYTKKYNIFRKLFSNEEEQYYFSYENVINIILSIRKHNDEIYKFKATDEYLMYMPFDCNGEQMSLYLKNYIKKNKRKIIMNRLR